MPNEQKVTRKLRAILSADVKGYSLLMSDDEEFTVVTLKAYRALMSDQIEQHTGRVVDAPGDNLLAEFASVVDAVKCAVEIQKILNEKNDALHEDKRLEFRIGVNIGDVIQDGDNIYGAGVNVAARIEGLADAGGISISRNAYDHVKDKLNYGYEYLGEHEVKNIKDPVRVYKVLLGPGDSGKLFGVKPKTSGGKWIFFAVLLAAIIFLTIVWNIDKKEPEPLGKPSIAVLPFDNMSNDPEQEYFSDGITEDIITDLSKSNDLLVISRNSTFTYKGQDKKLPEIAQELNVRYILEGSVRKSGNQVRITAQLIDAEKDHHIWAERFNGELKNVFELQDSITQKIVSALSIRLGSEEQLSISTIETNNIQAYDFVLKGTSLMRQITPESYAEASELLERAVELDPNYSRAYSKLASLYWWGATLGAQFWKPLNIDYYSGRKLGIYYLDLAMQHPTAEAHELAAHVAIARRQFKIAAKEAEKAIELNPNNSAGYAALSSVYKDVLPEKAISYAKIRMKLDPQSLGASLHKQGVSYFFMKDYEKAVELMERACVHNPRLKEGNAYLPAAYAHLGRNQDANRLYTDFYLKSFEGFPEPIPEHIIHIAGIQKPENADLLINGLIKAGLPAEPYNFCHLSEKEKLSVGEVKELVFGKTFTGYLWMWPGAQVWDSWSKDGLNTTKYLDFIEIKEFKFEQGVLCVLKDVRGKKIKSYQSIYRNPHGTSDNYNEYFLITETTVFAFTVIDN